MPEIFRGTAPGKIVLWGEYAVLADAPAAVLAIDRRAVCTIAPRKSGFCLHTLGFASPDIELSSLQIDQVPAAAILFAHAASALTQPLPNGLDITLDTADFHRQQEKLGIGSSAAALVACYGAMCALTGEEASLDRAISAHRAFQGSGSGLDVAAAMTGGVIRFQSGQARPMELPKNLHFAFVFSGKGVATGRQLGSFSRWRQQGNTRVLQVLADAASSLFDCIAPATTSTSTPSITTKVQWETYIEALQQLDTIAELGIYNDAHRQLERLSRSLGLVYKPCGAGGGDVGMAIGFNADDHALLNQFAQLCDTHGFMPLDLTGTPHGLHVEQ